MVSLIDFKANGDLRGQMVVIENNKQIPFEMKRLFYIFNTDKDAIRGLHSNIKSSFVFACLHGSVDVKTEDENGVNNFHLDSPLQGLYLGKLVWKEMYNFSDDCVLLVISDEPYDGNEYIREYAEFKKIIGDNKE